MIVARTGVARQPLMCALKGAVVAPADGQSPALGPESK